MKLTLIPFIIADGFILLLIKQYGFLAGVLGLAIMGLSFVVGYVARGCDA